MSSVPDWRPRFFIIWVGQSLSLIGSALTQFVLVWWITDKTGSGAALATAALMALLPQVLLGPLAGALVDRWDRRVVMIVADAVTAACILLLVGLFAFERVEVWHVYGLMLIRSTMQAFQQPAATASTSLLVPAEHLDRVAGLNQLVFGLMSVASAPLGALALSLLPIQGALLIDVVTAVAGILPLFVFAIPNARTGAQIAASSVLADLAAGLRFVWRWPGLVMLLVLGMVISAAAISAYTLQPLLVRNEFGGGVVAVAWIEALTGAGMIVGGLIMSAWGGFKRGIVTVLVGVIGIGVGQMITGVAPREAFPLAVGGGLVLGLALPLTNAPITAMIQRLVPAAMQGRVLGLLNSLFGLAGPLGLALTGPLSDAFGVRAIYVGGGLLITLVALAGFLVPALMTIETQLQPAGEAVKTAPLATSG